MFYKDIHKREFEPFKASGWLTPVHDTAICKLFSNCRQFVIISKYLQILREDIGGGQEKIIKFFYQSKDLLLTSPSEVIAHESHHKDVNTSRCLGWPLTSHHLRFL